MHKQMGNLSRQMETIKKLNRYATNKKKAQHQR